jgi:hypothetical protein
MENKLDIFVFTHRTPDFLPTNKCYKLVALECDKDKVKSNLETIICSNNKENIFNFERAYSEGSRIHYIWKNIELKEYVGTAHYRRFFDFMDDIPNLDEIFKTHDAILPKFNLWSNIEEQYSDVHNIKDLYTVIDIINDIYPEYYETALNCLKSYDFNLCNIFIMKKEMFNKYCEFVFSILDEFNKRMGFKTDLDVFNWVANNIDEYCSNKIGMINSIPYQARIQAFLMERIGNIFYKKNFKNPYLVELVITEINFDEEITLFKLYEK